MCVFDLGGDENTTGAGAVAAFLFGLILGISVSLTWNAGDESEGDKRSCSFVLLCGACTESGCICTQLLGFERIGSALLFVQVLAFSSLISPPISVFAAPALLLGNKYELAFSHPLTNFHSTFHAHGSVSGICLLDVSLHCCFFPLKV